MKRYDVTCPFCGTINHDLYLDETEGWMECEHCGQVINLKEAAELRKIQVYTGRQVAIIFADRLSAVQ